MRRRLEGCGWERKVWLMVVVMGATQGWALSVPIPQGALDRRKFVLRTAATLVGPQLLKPLDAGCASATERVRLDLKIVGEPELVPLELELFGEAAPKSVAQFTALAAGTLRAECAEPDEQFLARSTLSKASLERACLDSLGQGVSFEDSTLWRVVPDYRIDFGRVASRYASRIPPEVEPESSGLLNTRGAVSVKKGGGAFEFTIAPRDNPQLDKEDLVVIGRVADASLPTLDLLNALPSKKSPFDIGPPPPLGSSFARACEYGQPDTSCAANKPLRKVLVYRSVLSSSSSSSSR